MYGQMMALSVVPYDSRRPFRSAMIPATDVPQWTGGSGCDYVDMKKVGAVKTRTPAFKHWHFGIYQLPLWLGGSRRGKKDTPERKALQRANARERKAAKGKGKGKGDGKGKARKRKGKGNNRKGKAKRKNY